MYQNMVKTSFYINTYPYWRKLQRTGVCKVQTIGESSFRHFRIEYEATIVVKLKKHIRCLHGQGKAKVWGINIICKNSGCK